MFKINWRVSVLGLIICIHLCLLIGCATPYEQLRSAIDRNNLKKAEQSLKSGANSSKALNYAVKNKRVDIVRLLLNRGADPNHSKPDYIIENLLAVDKTMQIPFNTKWDEKNNNILVVAEDGVKVELLSGIILRKFTYSYKAKKMAGRTPIFDAIDNNDIENIKLLLEYGADITRLYVIKGALFIPNSPVHQGYFFHRNNFTVRSAAGTHYVRHKGNNFWSNTVPFQGEVSTAFDYARSKKNTKLLHVLENYKKTNVRENIAKIQEAIQAGADVNVKNKYGFTPLFMASWKGHTEVVKLLLAARADVNVADKDGVTPLWQASWKGHAEVVKLLLSGKADVNATRKTDGATPLNMASWKGHIEVVKLLIAGNADVNAARKTDGANSLLTASQEGHTEVVKLLLAAGADVNIRLRVNGTDYTPLSIAKRMSHTRIIKLLKEYGAKD